MKKFYIVLFLIVIFSYSCKKEQDPNLIGKQNIGLLNDSTQIKDIKALFINDSIVINKPSEFSNNSTVELYNKQGDKLLEITPLMYLHSCCNSLWLQFQEPH